MEQEPGIDSYPGYHIAEFNIGRLKYPKDSIEVKDFMDALDHVNSMGETTEGFVWMLKDEEGYGATGVEAFDDPQIIVNYTIWDSIDKLHTFTYSGDHIEVFRRRREWFEKHEQPSLVLWWIKEGEIPSIEEAKERLDYLRRHGPSPFAFNFTKRFVPAD